MQPAICHYETEAALQKSWVRPGLSLQTSFAFNFFSIIRISRFPLVFEGLFLREVIESVSSKPGLGAGFCRLRRGKHVVMASTRAYDGFSSVGRPLSRFLRSPIVFLMLPEVVGAGAVEAVRLPRRCSLHPRFDRR